MHRIVSIHQAVYAILHGLPATVQDLDSRDYLSTVRQIGRIERHERQRLSSGKDGGSTVQAAI